MSFTRALIALPAAAFRTFSAEAAKEGLKERLEELLENGLCTEVVRRDGSVWIALAFCSPAPSGWERCGRLEKRFRRFLEALPEGSRQFVTMTEGRPSDYEILGEDLEDPIFRIIRVPHCSVNFREEGGTARTLRPEDARSIPF